MARKPEVQYIQFYTDGSAARQIAPKAAPRKKSAAVAAPKKAKRVILYVDPVAISGIVVAAVMVVLMAFGVFELVQTNRELRQMEGYVETLQVRNAELSARYASGYQLDDIEQKALAIGMIPVEQAQQIVIHVDPVRTVEEPTLWERFSIFLSGLFA